MFVNEFASQWLSLDKFQVLEAARKQYPKLSRDVRSQLKLEPAEFLKYLIHNNLPARNVTSSDFILANEVTADYYDLAGGVDSGFDFVPVRHGGRELGGVLTEAAIMAGLSDGRESNPVKRGAWLARRIIAEPPILLRPMCLRCGRKPHSSRFASASSSIAINPAASNVTRRLTLGECRLRVRRGWPEEAAN
jgi:hypothetical protein